MRWQRMLEHSQMHGSCSTLMSTQTRIGATTQKSSAVSTNSSGMYIYLHVQVKHIDQYIRCPAPLRELTSLKRVLGHGRVVDLLFRYSLATHSKPRLPILSLQYSHEKLLTHFDSLVVTPLHPLS